MAAAKIAEEQQQQQQQANTTTKQPTTTSCQAISVIFKNTPRGIFLKQNGACGIKGY